MHVEGNSLGAAGLPGVLSNEGVEFTRRFGPALDMEGSYFNIGMGESWSRIKVHI
jgi:hypothetical protein